MSRDAVLKDRYLAARKKSGAVETVVCGSPGWNTMVQSTDPLDSADARTTMHDGLIAEPVVTFVDGRVQGVAGTSLEVDGRRVLSARLTTRQIRRVLSSWRREQADASTGEYAEIALRVEEGGHLGPQVASNYFQGRPRLPIWLTLGRVAEDDLPCADFAHH
jgi:hypothetical protein